MLQLFKYVYLKLVFFIRYRPNLASAGRRVVFFPPVRIDGAQYISIGSRTSIQSNSWLYAEGQPGAGSTLKIGSGSVLGHANHITAIRSVTIGNSVLTANQVYISDNSHSYEDILTPILNQPVEFRGEVKIGDGSWLGENVCVIGASVGKNCVIGANSVVTHDIPDYCVAVGAPARIIKQYSLSKGAWIIK